MGFVLWNAWTAFQCLDKKRLALLKAADIDCDLGKVMSSPRAWAATLQGKTIREVLDVRPLD